MPVFVNKCCKEHNVDAVAQKNPKWRAVETGSTEADRGGDIRMNVEMDQLQTEEIRRNSTHDSS